MNQPDDATTTGEPAGEVATTVRLRQPWYKVLLTAALIATVPLAVGGVASMQYLDALEPQPTTAVPDNTSRYEGPIDDSVQHVAARRTVEIDPATGGVTVPSKEDRVRELSGTGDLDMPAAALKAYRNAAATLANTDPSCNIDWALLAGIGRVESDHGRYGGATVSTNGKTYPHILGLPLDGSPGVAAIADTDGGALDSDTTWDRAVGPMQFIPSTWGMVAADGDGDGERDPHDLDDAALAAGVYLCAGAADVSTRAGAEAAVFSYNHSDEYVAMVLAIAEAYRSGEVYLPSVPYGSGGGSAPTLSKAPGNGPEHAGSRRGKTQAGNRSQSKPDAPAPKRESVPAQEITPTPTSTPKPKSTRPSTPKQSKEPEPEPEPDPPEDDEEEEKEEVFKPEPINLSGTPTQCAGGSWCLPDTSGQPLPMDLSGIAPGVYDDDPATDLDAELRSMVADGVEAYAAGETQESGTVRVSELVADERKAPSPSPTPSPTPASTDGDQKQARQRTAADAPAESPEPQATQQDSAESD